MKWLIHFFVIRYSLKFYSLSLLNVLVLYFKKNEQAYSLEFSGQPYKRSILIVIYTVRSCIGLGKW